MPNTFLAIDILPLFNVSLDGTTLIKGNKSGLLEPDTALKGGRQKKILAVYKPSQKALMKAAALIKETIALAGAISAHYRIFIRSSSTLHDNTTSTQ